MKIKKVIKAQGLGSGIVAVAAISMLGIAPACATKSAAAKPEAAAAPAPATATAKPAAQTTPVAKTPETPEAAPAEKPARSPQLYQALLKVGAREVKKTDGKSLAVFDLTCSMKPTKNGEDMVSNCEFFNQPEGVKGRKRTVKTGADAEKLRELLFGFQVAQGDSGAMTPYVKCESYGSDPACSIAVEVDYVGP
jgi:hypothetical protein